MEDRRYALDKRVTWLKETLKHAMEETGKIKFKTQLFSFSVQKNPPRVVLDVAPDMVPDEYLIPQDPKVDMAAIKDALKAGAATGIAHLVQTTRISIR